MRARHGFTLIELAIVLVIIGLLVGGVLAGRELMHAQALRNTLQQAKTYAIAKQLFQEKYGYLPGDMPTAMRVWGAATGVATDSNCSDPEHDVSVGKLTCNGNGNGIIESSGSENFRAWQQLVAAEMIAGSFAGVHGSGGVDDAEAGINVPASVLEGGAFSFQSLGDLSTNPSYFPGIYDNIMVFGKARTDDAPYNGAITAVEAQNMDAKVDDGKPGYGTVRTYTATTMRGYTGSECVTTDVASSSEYSTAFATQPVSCFLVFMSDFQAKPK